MLYYLKIYYINSSIILFCSIYIFIPVILNCINGIINVIHTRVSRVLKLDPSNPVVICIHGMKCKTVYHKVLR